MPSVAMEGLLQTCPLYIQRLLSNETVLDYTVIVGEEDGPKEEIKVMKWMLLSQSRILEQIAAEGDQESNTLRIYDLPPDTFKVLLICLYGYDITPKLQVEDNLPLLCSAIKYEMEEVKEKVDKTLCTQINLPNVCLILKSIDYCENAKRVWERVTCMVKYTTEGVFADPHFSDIPIKALKFILEQKMLSVYEGDVCKAVLQWCKHNLARYHFTKEDIRENIISNLFLHSVRDDEAYQELSQFFTSSENEDLRSINLDGISGSRKIIDFEEDSSLTSTPVGEKVWEGTVDVSRFWILTKDCPVQLYGLECSQSEGCRGIDKDDWTRYYTKVNVDIRRTIFSRAGQTTLPFVQISFDKHVPHMETKRNTFILPMKHEGQYIDLQPNSKYQITMIFDPREPHRPAIYYSHSGQGYKTTTGFEMICGPIGEGTGYFGAHCGKIYFKVFD